MYCFLTVYPEVLPIMRQKVIFLKGKAKKSTLLQLQATASINVINLSS